MNDPHVRVPAPRPAGWDSGRGLEPGYAYGQSGGRIPQSLPRGRFGGGLRQLHLSAAWTSHNPTFPISTLQSVP